MIGDTIRAARLEHGLSLRELARQTEFTPSYLCDIEQGARRGSEEVLEALGQLLGLDVDILMCEAGRLGLEAEAYMKRQPLAIKLLRVLARQEACESELLRLIAHVNELQAPHGGLEARERED